MAFHTWPLITLLRSQTERQVRRHLKIILFPVEPPGDFILRLYPAAFFVVVVVVVVEK